MTDTPRGAQYRIGGGFYKIGLRRMVFFWSGLEWTRSTMTRKELEAIASPV